ncbi:hypothetical protein C4D60_Mb08t10340 [Musa balbisiana]|uniref:Uncharacterized protein n=1 Tax=Musa balbisiana TaxID=52838 RepID=A0A4S8K2R1_MUSBA|nr:hypothetical protein C4D60_Mb08t10340 [Musa balbisiana]
MKAQNLNNIKEAEKTASVEKRGKERKKKKKKKKKKGKDLGLRIQRRLSSENLVVVALSFFSLSPRLRPLTSRRWGEEGCSKMKKVGVFVAFLVATFSAALAAASPDPRASSSSFKEVRLSSLLPPRSGSSREGDAGSGSRKGMEDKFALRFDMIRFIETLVTMHR